LAVNWQSTRTATDVLVSGALAEGPVDMGIQKVCGYVQYHAIPAPYIVAASAVACTA
jgi:hypothetical protein